MLADRLRDRHEDDAGLGEFGAEGRRHRNRIKDRVDRNLRRAFNAEKRLGLLQRDAELFKIREDFLRHVVERLPLSADRFSALKNNRRPDNRSADNGPSPIWALPSSASAHRRRGAIAASIPALPFLPKCSGSY